jgi:hypothetical protein
LLQQVSESHSARTIAVRKKGGQMNPKQGWASKELESELRKRGQNAKIDWEESSSNESCGCLFGQFEGVTLMVYPEGLISIPAVCSYTASSPAIAAASAKDRFDRQKARDDANPKKARDRQGGHLGPILSHDLRCGNELCHCKTETSQERQRRARGAYNTVQWWETNTTWRLGPV